MGCTKSSPPKRSSFLGTAAQRRVHLAKHPVCQQRQTLPNTQVTTEYVETPDGHILYSKVFQPSLRLSTDDNNRNGNSQPMSATNVKGMICYCAGYGSFCDWTDTDLADYFVQRGYIFVTYDHWGHGRSDGVWMSTKNGSCHTWTDDAIFMFERAKRRYTPTALIGTLKYFLFGHSMGGAVAIQVSRRFTKAMGTRTRTRTAMRTDRNIVAEEEEEKADVNADNDENAPDPEQSASASSPGGELNPLLLSQKQHNNNNNGHGDGDDDGDDDGYLPAAIMHMDANLDLHSDLHSIHSKNVNVNVNVNVNAHAIYGWHGMVLSAPMVKIADALKPSKVVQHVLEYIALPVAPHARMIPSKSFTNAITRDDKYLAMIEQSPLYYDEKPTLNMGSAMMTICMDIEANMHTIELPMLLMHGSADTVTDPNMSQLLMDKCRCMDKKFMLYENGFHALLLDTIRDEVYNDVIQWMQERS